VFGLTFGHSLSAVQPHSTYQASSVYSYYRTSVTTAEQRIPTYLNMSATAQSFTEKEREELVVDRKRYLAHAFVTAGIALPSAAESNPEDIVTGVTVTSETEKITAVAAIRSSQCPAHGQGCTIDHGATLYGTTLTRRSGKVVQIPLIEDSGSGPNWMPRALARDLQCELRDIVANDARRCVDFGGTEHRIKKKITLSLNGMGNRAEEVDFCIAPEGFPLHCAVLGRDFIDSVGHPYQFFPAKPDSIGIIIQSQITVSEIYRN
jgi:hypothetical protein